MKGGVVNRTAVSLLSIYRKLLSPLFAGLGAQCRFHPSCSEYAETSFRRFETLKAVRLTVTRLCKCGPWTEGGIDPVPTN